MIAVEGFKAFHGTMLISPRVAIEPFEITGDWLYKPEYKCWYGGGRSFPEEICKIVKEETHE
jgi:hypothetical protein